MSTPMNEDHSGILPPGHPATTDAPISAGAVLSGRGQRAGGGSLGPTARSAAVAESPAAPPEDGQPTVESSSPTVLVAVEDDEHSVRTLRVAHRLFGDGARYLAINVGEGGYASMQWAYVFPVSVPQSWSPAASKGDQPSKTVAADDRAAAVAESVADAAGMPSVKELGDIGDPATAILSAAQNHGVDVVVIGSHERGWFSRLLSGSVEQDLMRTGDFSVLVVK